MEQKNQKTTVKKIIILFIIIVLIPFTWFFSLFFYIFLVFYFSKKENLENIYKIDKKLWDSISENVFLFDENFESKTLKNNSEILEKEKEEKLKEKTIDFILEKEKNKSEISLEKEKNKKYFQEKSYFQKKKFNEKRYSIFDDYESVLDIMKK